MAKTFFTYEIDSAGATIQLMEKHLLQPASPVPVRKWADQADKQGFSGLSRILSLLDDPDSTTEARNDGVFIDHQTIASLTEPEGLDLGLPPSVHAALQIGTKNLIVDPAFQISAQWIGEGNRRLQAKREGAFITLDARYRIPEPFFSLIDAIDKFSNTDASHYDERMAHIARLQSLIPQDAVDKLKVDGYFSSFRVFHATAFSLYLRTDADAFNFDPVLFGRRVINHSRGEDEPVSEAESLLTGHQQDIFANQRFVASETARPSYVVESGVYVHVDASLREALAIVRRMQAAEPDIRKQFARSPQLYLKENLAGIVSDSDVEKLFIETEQYSARVIDLGIWVAPVLPWIKRQPNDWLPEKFGLQVGDQYIVLDPDELPELRARISDAIKEGEPFVEFGTEKVRIPATQATEKAIQDLTAEVRPEPKPPEVSPSTPEPSAQKHVLIVEDNYDKTGYRRTVEARPRGTIEFPVALRSTLKKHQESGFEWLRHAWLKGYSGVLLADDMGLGKTLQALTFLLWIHENSTAGNSFRRHRGPMLIVAPTGLLANWEKEHDHHLHEPGLGELCRAFGRHLKLLKIRDAKDIDQGVPALDKRRIQQAKWVLTTYETLRDYHLSFASIPFSCAVFDEIQKVKSPSSLLTRAAKTVNADFLLGITGTPIENQLADLWCIMDIIDPGELGDLKGFSNSYSPDNLDSLKKLREVLLDATEKGPQLILRRMKVDHLEGLPEKKVHIRRRMMSHVQAKAYADVVKRAKDPASGPMLETLHLLRGVSLHPIWPPAGEIQDPQSFIDQSARLIETFSILDKIKQSQEKALIFLESLELQSHLALMIKNRYGLKHRPMQINGDIAGEKRQKLVDRFQQERGEFDVMILSPRAGGVGLTLTAANHVIHLSRWWNPAVEDQCTDRVYRIGQDQAVHVYYPMAVHPAFSESSFDELLNALLDNKRELSKTMLLPPVNLKQDQKWFTDHLARDEQKVSPFSVEEIDHMEPLEFERWALGRCASIGWEVYSTPLSHDAGADGILKHRHSDARAIIQCKHTQRCERDCDATAIDDLLRARARYSGANRLFVLTNANQFSFSAKDRAQMHGITLIGREQLGEWPQQLLQ